MWRDYRHSTLSLLPMSLRKWQLQSCARTWYLEILFWTTFTKFIVYFGEEISSFRLCRGGRGFLPWKFMPIPFFFFKNFKLTSQRKKPPFVVWPTITGKVLELSPWRIRGGSAGGTILKRSVVFRRDRSEFCQNRGVWLFKTN
jgi:hypothetical protein